MMYRDSTAYDFELFAPKKKEVVEIPVSARRQSTRAKSRKKSAPLAKNRLVLVAAVVTVLLLMVAQLHCQLQNSEVVCEIDQTKTEIRNLKSDNTRLQSELSGVVSFTNMEKAAKEMGMQKMTVAQTEYINLNTEDSVEVIGNEGGLKAAVQGLF